MNPPAPTRSARSALLALIACASTLLACAEDNTSVVWDFGPAKITPPEASVPDSSPVVLNELAQQPCSTPALKSSDPHTFVRSLSSGQGRLVLTLTDAVENWQLDDQGCPLDRIASFGKEGRVTMEALSAVPLEAGRVLVASGATTVLLDSSGMLTASCKEGDTDVKARWVAPTPEGTALALLVRSPIQVVASNLADPSQCVASKRALAPETFSLLAVIATSDSSGFLTAEQTSATEPIALARYDNNGNRTASVSWPASQPGALRSVVGLLETPRGIVVVDSDDKRLVLYDATTLEPTAEALFEDTPRGVATTNNPTAVLVPVTRAVASGSEANFVVVNLQ